MRSREAIAVVEACANDQAEVAALEADLLNGFEATSWGKPANVLSRAAAAECTQVDAETGAKRCPSVDALAAAVVAAVHAERAARRVALMDDAIERAAPTNQTSTPRPRPSRVV